MRGMHDTITVWNKALEAGKTAYYRHVIPYCYWGAHIVRTVTGTSVSLGTSWMAMVSAQDDYRPYSEWIELLSDDKAKYFTFNVGDIVARGDKPNEMTPANSTTMYNSMKPDVFTVKIVDDRTQEWKQAPHIKIEGA